MLTHIFSDRRAQRRVFLRVPMTYETIDPQTNAKKAKAVSMGDINESGAYFESDEPLPLKSEITLLFKLPKSVTLISARAKIMRIEATEKGDLFGFGVAFISMADKDRLEIKRFVESYDLQTLLRLTIENEASDLHLIVDSPPVLRARGDLKELDMPKLSAEAIQHLVFSLMTKQQILRFQKEQELDFGLQFDALNRFRVNLHIQKGFTEAVFRLITTRTFSFEALRIPDVVKELALSKSGLILIAGPTGSGKSTTIAAMVDLINRERKAVIITLERPIEYVHERVLSIIKQREIGVDTKSFSMAIQTSLRQDPDVIVVGEIDEPETAKTSLIAAEAGYLVIASLHAPDTLNGIDRLIGLFPMESRKQILAQLANCTRGMITQMLVPTIDGNSRVLATEVVIMTEALKRIIRADELIQIPNIIQTGKSYKMHSMRDSLRQHIADGLIDPKFLDTLRGVSQER